VSVRVPTEACLDSIFTALQASGLERLPGARLLDLLNELAAERWPVADLACCDDLLEQPCFAALAFSLVLLWPPGQPHARVAHAKFLDLATGFEAVWDKVPHNKQQKLRKIVDHLVVVGVQESVARSENWSPAMDVFYTLLNGNPRRYHGPIGECARFLRGNPIGPPGENGAQAMDGLIPDLDLCWQEDFRLDANYHVAAIMNRILQPFIEWPTFVSGDFITFDWDDEREAVVVESHWPSVPELQQDRVPVGARRTYRLKKGSAVLRRGGIEWAKVPEGQRMILRVMDHSKAQIQLAVPMGRDNIGGHILSFGPGDGVCLETLTDGTIIEAWSCTCGTWKCDKRHRLAAWDPWTMPAEMTLKSFLWTAVKGATAQLHIKSFISGMYYAMLCNGD